jgi:hypothetical protein
MALSSSDSSTTGPLAGQILPIRPQPAEGFPEARPGFPSRHWHYYSKSGLPGIPGFMQTDAKNPPIFKEALLRPPPDLDRPPRHTDNPKHERDERPPIFGD